MAERGAARPEGRGGGADLLFSAALFIAALLPRLVVAIDWASEPVWDAHYYDFGARRIATGAGYSDDVVTDQGVVWHPWCHYPVGYSGFLAIAYRLFGPEHPVGTIQNALVGAMTAVIVHRLALAFTTTRRARLAGALAAFSPGLIAYTGVLMTELLAGLGLVLAPWLLVRLRERRPLGAAVVAGLALGLTTLVRPQTILVLPALAALGTPLTTSLRARLVKLVVLCAVVGASALAVVAPWTLRNCLVMDGCAFVSTNGGWNLAIGSSPKATGRFEQLRAGDGCDDVTGQVQQDRCWWERGVDWIEQDPMRWVGLVPIKLSHTFDHESFPVGYFAEADPARWPEERRFEVRGALSATHRALLAVAALGVVAWPLTRRGDRPGSKLMLFDLAALVALVPLWVTAADKEGAAWPIAVFIPIVALLRAPFARWAGRLGDGRYASGLVGYAAFSIATLCVTHAIFFGEDRYHVVLTPLLALLAASALPRGDAPPSRGADP